MEILSKSLLPLLNGIELHPSAFFIPALVSSTKFYQKKKKKSSLFFILLLNLKVRYPGKSFNLAHT